MKFKDKKEEQNAIGILKEGSKSPFWKLIIKALEESKEFIQQQMDADEMQDLDEKLYKFMNETYKAKKAFIDSLMKTPENIMSWLDTPPAERPKDFDPYEKEN